MKEEREGDRRGEKKEGVKEERERRREGGR